MKSDPSATLDPLDAGDGTSRTPLVLLMRHPQTIANEQHRYLGQRDIDLTEKGQRQRDLAVAALVAWKPDRIFSSPMERCLSIAKPAARQLGLALEVDPCIAEMCFGALEGLTRQEAEDSGIPFPWGPTSDRWPAPGGESLESFFSRLSQACDRYSTFSGRTAVVSHGGAIRGMCAYWMHMPPDQLWSMEIGNVASALFAFRSGMPMMRGFGLKPDEIASR